MTNERFEQIKQLAKQWKEIASDVEAAPTGSMLNVINELIAAYETPYIQQYGRAERFEIIDAAGHKVKGRRLD